MFQVTPQMRILVGIEPVDGRKGIDSLAQLCRAQLGEDPFSGCVFLFRNKNATTLTMLAYDGQGFWLARNDCPRVASGGGRTPPNPLPFSKPTRPRS
jgi:transposase